MDLIKILGGKWLKTGEKMGKEANVIMFDASLRLIACNFMGTKITKGYYYKEQQIMIFLNGRLADFTIDISSSGDILTITDSEGMKTEYIKYSNYTPHSIYFFDSNDTAADVLFDFAKVIMVIIIVLIMIYLFVDAQ